MADDDKKIPSKTLARNALGSKTVAKAGLKTLQRFSTAPLFNSKARKIHDEQTHREIADIIFEGLKQLRGTALKLAQVLSGEMGLLPDTYLNMIESAHSQVPPLSDSVIRKVFISELGDPPENLFKRFDSVAFAAASLGQVHKARVASGQEVAVKVQYPGINESIQSDLKLARFYFKSMPGAQLILRTIEELQWRLTEEIDYRIEFNNTHWFRLRNPYPNVVIPEVHPHLSTQKVLTAERIEGLHLREWLKTQPSQEQRNVAAQTLFDFFCYFLFHHQRVHCDSNLGNFLFLNDSKVAIIDFGAVKKLQPETLNLLTQLWQHQPSNNHRTLVPLYIKAGAQLSGKNAHEKFYRQVVEPYANWLHQLFAGHTYDFSQNSDSLKVGPRLFAKGLFHPSLKNISPDFALIHRTFHGLLSIFHRLGATVHLKNQQNTKPDSNTANA